ncbi:MAG TPA: hypothetical protein VGB07_05570 [Blastocatellia bacterium]
MAEETKSATVEELFAVAQAPPAVRRVLSDIFGDIHPMLEGKTEIGSIFKPEAATDLLKRLTDFEAMLSEEDSYNDTLNKFQKRIDDAEKLRDEVMAKLFEEIRPLEASYRQIWLFFENSVVPDGKQRQPVEFHVYNADPTVMKNRESTTLAAVREFVASRNDQFNFRQYICNLAIPGEIPMVVREALEEEAWKWGMLLVTDITHETSFKAVYNQFRTGGRYEFLKRPEDKASSDIVLVGELKMRDAHWFEKDLDEDPDLYAPSSLVFAGALARTDRQTDAVVQGPIGSKFGQIKGVDKARIECRVSQMEELSMNMQVIPVIRDADNHLCFFGCRTLADDPYGVYKFFTAYRVLMYIERRVGTYLRQVAGQVLTRDFMDKQVEDPLRRLLDEQKNLGTIMEYKLFVDKDSNKRMQGICDIELEVMPTGPAEVFRVKIDVPEFKPEGKEPDK